MEEHSNWSDARDVCTARGERLAQPDNQGKNQFLTEKVRTAKGFTGDGVWFGASRNAQDISQWLYTDGLEVAFTSWNSGLFNYKLCRSIQVFTLLHLSRYLYFIFVSNYQANQITIETVKGVQNGEKNIASCGMITNVALQNSFSVKLVKRSAIRIKISP